jgi:ligand-binding sensor domain-containing protein/signal transduction histidine kinase
MVSQMSRMLMSALLSAFLVPGTALAVSSPPSAFSERTWQIEDGLPEQTVQAFAQTSDHYLWIGTTGGLLRFDGAHFVLYDRENTPALPDTDVFSLMVARDNSLWIGTEGGGLVRYQDGVFHSFSAAQGLTNGFVRAVLQDGRGNIWIGTDNGLFRLEGTTIARVDNTQAVPEIAVHALALDRRGRVWAGGSRLLCLDNGTAVDYRLQGQGSQNRVKSITQTRDGTMWVGAIGGLYKMDSGADSFHPVANVTGTVRFLHQTSDGTLWIGTIGHGIYKYRDHRLTQMTAPESLPSNTTLNLFEDVEKNIWIGTQEGMLRLSKTPVETVALPDSGDYDAETVYEDHNGDLWVAAANLFRFHDGKVRRVHIPGISGVRVRNVFRDRNGAMWIGTEGRGAFRQTGTKLVHYMTKNGLVNNFVRAFLQSRDGSVWIATDEGVSRWTPAGFTNFRMSDGLSYFSTRCLLEDSKDDIWIGTDHGVSHLHNGKFVNDALTAALADEKIWAIREDSDGGLWFGTRNGGLYRWRFGKLVHFTTAQGLASNSIFEMLKDQKGNFWMSGPNGISVISRHELDLVAQDPQHPLPLRLYGISDGLETTQLYGAEKPGGVLTRNGEAWFASNKGPVRIALARDHHEKLVPVVIDEVLADGLKMPNQGVLSLAPDNAKLEFHYGVVMLRSQEKIRFRYILEGFDKGWTDASSRTVAYYTNIPAGHYRFRVAAFEMEDPATLSETSVQIIQRPHFYQSYWFLGFCLLLLAGLVLAVHQIRVRQLNARFQAVLSERSRLAREMHDTLIQGCAGISALLEAHYSLDETQARTKDDLLDCVRSQLRLTIDEAREAVWDLRSGNGSTGNIDPLLRNMTERMGREFGIPVTYECSGVPFELDPAVAHELIMVIREALHNAVRHGHPTCIQLRISFETDQLTAKIADDGCGFDPGGSTVSEGHYGLTGMRERVARIGGVFGVKSCPGAGTQLSLEIPRRLGIRHPEMFRA